MPSSLPHRKSNALVELCGQIGWPLLWGVAATVGFYFALDQRLIPGGTSIQHFVTSTPVAYLQSTLFFVGLVLLAMQGLAIIHEHLTLDQIQLPTPQPGGDRPDSNDCQSLLAYLGALPARLRDGYMARRLRAAIQYVERLGSADNIESHLRERAGANLIQRRANYALSGLIARAIPLLGVVAVALAIGNPSPEVFTEAQGFAALTARVTIAFDATVTTVGLTLMLVCIQFVVDRSECALLAAVDQRVSNSLIGRFQQIGAATDPQAASVRRMADVVVRASEELVARQAELWQDTIEAAHQQWSQLSGATGHQVQQALEKALTRSLLEHAQHVTAAERDAREQLSQTGERVASALDMLAKSTEKQHTELGRQGATLIKAIDAATRTLQSQQLLHEQPAAATGVPRLEEMMTSLAAAIHLLNSRLGGMSGAPTSVQMHAVDSKGRAA